MPTGQHSELAVRNAVFQVVSVQTTTGLITVDYELWPFAGQLLLLLLMFVVDPGLYRRRHEGVAPTCSVGRVEPLVASSCHHPGCVCANIPSREVVTNVLGFSVLYIVIFPRWACWRS